MLKHIEITRQRITNFLTKDALGGRFYTQTAPVQLAVYSAPGRISYQEAVQAQYRPTQIGERFAPPWSTHWFKVKAIVPPEWKGQEVHLLWNANAEGLLYQDGQPTQGLVGSSNGYNNNVLRGQYVLSRDSAGGEQYEMMIEAALNGMFGLWGPSERTANLGLLQQAEIAIFDRQAWDLFWDLRVVADMALLLPENTPRGGQALYAANAMINAINLDDRNTWPAARQIAADFLSTKNGGGQHNLSAIGHAHIDTAWLWPLAETVRKCARTFTTALRYMDEYPDYLFVCSQAQQLEWIKERYPGLYSRIKQRVKDGRFIPAGGSWVEPDCNIPSGESMARQFLYGQRFFRQEFGITCNEFWEPDVFGYSAALPQILQQAGIQNFLTIKLSWNQFNKPNVSTFLWEGLDGSRVLTHFPPLSDYNSMANVPDLLRNVADFKDHERANESYLLFGYGDGGGGPTLEMLEQLKRVGDVDGLPRTAQRTPQEFFTRAANDIKDPLVWVGELYFELHRGTYTTQALTKKYNRQTELLLRDVELLSSLAHVCGGMAYPQEEVTRLWKLVLTNQFHDIIPGSSIAEVYKDSTRHYEEVLTSGSALRQQALQALMPAAGQGPRLLALNTTGFERREVVELPEGMSGEQLSADGKALGVVDAPACGYDVREIDGEPAGQVTVDRNIPGRIILENEYVRVELGEDGRLYSLFDKRAVRDSIAAGEAGNQFVLFDDNPNRWDAWDVDVFHLEKRTVVPPAVNCRVIESGPLRASVSFEYHITPSSSIHQTVSLTAVSPRLDFDTTVDWHEQHKFLKVEFPVNVRAQNATYEIQFGHLERPTHFNTTWDLARFEVVGHKWADLSDSIFGVALLNDSKYGYAAHGNVLRLSLLRATVNPDPTADQGRHTFRYALLPHQGSVEQAGVVAEGYSFNVPLLLAPTSAMVERTSYFQVSHPSLVIDTLKKAEDSDALILRMYESSGAQRTVSVSTSLPVRSAARCNLLEEEDQPIEWTDAGAVLNLRPFEIVTLKLEVG
jgi:alpha-mannosidase